ncbi:Mitochondrial import inner membrane translocase subunit Tim23 [Aphelenchoides besseyi]|nr:Mitochondrial import inner membrane translocase subunit Tim23 [Aphelenchoides besseyi]
MNFFGSGSTVDVEVPSNAGTLDDHSFDQSASSQFAAPVLALDRLKQAGVPLKAQMSPYLQVKYIMPEGNEHGKGKFEFALGHIGWAVASGFGAGCLRGFVPELMNAETRQLRGRPWLTRMVNATVKHGSGYAQPAGAAIFMFSAFEILLRQLRADDDLNSLAAGAFTGALYRSPYGLRASGAGAGVGLALATIWLLGNSDSRMRIKDMINFA